MNCKLCTIKTKKIHIVNYLKLCVNCKDWKTRVKSKCVICEATIPKTAEQRGKFGNWCSSCNAKAIHDRRYYDN